MTYLESIHHQVTDTPPTYLAYDHQSRILAPYTAAEVRGDVNQPVATEGERQTASTPPRYSSLPALKAGDTSPCQVNHPSLAVDMSSSHQNVTPPPTTGEPGGFLQLLYEFNGSDLLSSIIKPSSSKSSVFSMFKQPAEPQPDDLRVDHEDEHKDESDPRPSFNMPSNRTSAQSTDLEKQHHKDKNWKPGRKEWLVMVTLAISSLTVALDATILVTTLPTLARDLNGSATEAFWAGTSYLLTSAVVQPFIASLSDIFGRRELLIPSILLFLLGSIICGVAHNFTTLLSGRVVQGIGGGGIITLAQVIYGDIVPLRQRPRYFALVLGAWAAGTMFGPLIGGAFTEKATWRWCFYLNIPICGIALPMAFFLVKLQTERKSLAEKVREVDWTGGLIFIASLTSFLVGLSWGGTQYSWSSGNTLAPLIIGGFGVLLSLLYEWRYAPNPFMTRSLFPNTSACATYIAALFQGMLLFMALYYLSFYFLAAKLQTPIHTGVDMFPGTFLVLPGSIVVSALITRTGKYRWAVWSGWAITAIGVGLFILFKTHTSTAVWATALCIFGLGTGMTLSSINFAVQASITVTRDSGRAAGMYAFMRTLGMTVGVAIGGTIFQNLMKHKLKELGLPTDIAKDAEGFVSILHKLGAGSRERLLAQEAYVKGFQGVFIFMTVASIVALLVSALIKHFSLDRVLESRYSLDPEKLQQMASEIPRD